jgi:exonuclease III
LEARRHNIEALLVDFAAKGLESEEEDFKASREKFYAGRLEEIRQQREEMPKGEQGEKDLRERLAWEREMLGTLKGEAEEKEKVLQVFDRRLNQEEKEALGAVLR